MKNIIKKNYKFLLGILIGAIITATSAYAVTSIASSSVAYNNTTSGLSSTNVKDALDEIYSIQNSGDAKASDILSGKKAFSGGKLITGTYTIPELKYEILYKFGNGNNDINSSESYTYTFTKSCKYVIIFFATSYYDASTFTTSFENRKIVDSVNTSYGLGTLTYVYKDVNSGNTVSMSKTSGWDNHTIICANY